MKKRHLLTTGIFCLGLTLSVPETKAEKSPSQNPLVNKPNIIVVLADDLGYGDVHCFDPQYAKIPTPCVDRLAQQGLSFTDAHDGASLCTPSRYALLTGRFSWRTPLQRQVMDAYGAPLIAPDRLTLPRMLQQQGYQTACFGKWHLGWDWALRQKDGSIARAPKNQFLRCRREEWNPVFEESIAQGPITRGFDYYFGVDTPNGTPHTFIENDRMVVNPTKQDKWGVSAPGWREDRMLPTILEKTESYIAERAREKKPFLLYLALTSPHTPIAPSEPFVGKSGINREADFIMETDAALGRVVTALEKTGQADNTIVIFTSDNGHAGYLDLKPYEKVGHRVSGPYRGYKNDLTEGGHRIPLVVRWPGVVKPATRSGQMVCLSDLMATCAEMFQVKLPDNAAEDSVSFLSLLQGQDAPTRRYLVNQCYSTPPLAIRDGPWKLGMCPGYGPGLQGLTMEDAIRRGISPVQLHNLVDDPGETTNLATQHPEIVQRLRAQLEKYISEGRSTPGMPQKNDVEVKLQRTDKDAKEDAKNGHAGD